MLLTELMQFTMDDSYPSNASERFRLKGEEAQTDTQIRTALAQLVQAVLSGQIRKKEYDAIKATLEQRLGALRSTGKVSDVARDTIVPDQAQPYGPNVRY